MRLPQASYKNKGTTFIQQFLGYDHNLRTQAGEFYDMNNMSLDNYPVISTRQGEEDILALSGNPNGLWEYAPDTLMAVSGNLLRIGITKSSRGEILPESAQYLTDSEKSFATIGAYTVIMPDKVIFNSQTKALSNIVRSFTSKAYGGQYLVIQMIPCDIDGKTIDYESGTTAPVDTTKYWYDTANGVFKKYSTSTEQWIQLESPYVKLVPRISASESAYTAPTGTLDENAIKDKKEVSDFFGTFSPLDTITYSATQNATSEDDWFDYIVYGTGAEDETNYIILSMIEVNKVTSFTVRTKCPDLDHLVALNNRVWGVSNSTHEIFACKLGDPTQWFNYAGIASDSYAISLGFADEVTASAAYNNYIHFFTEDKIIKIYGDYPSNYQMHTTKADGVISGGHDTVANVEGILYYVSPIGVMRYDGSMPYFCGQKFAPNFLAGKTVAAGRDGMKYCLSVSKNGVSEGVFVLDTGYGLWAKAGEQIIVKSADLGSALCFMTPQAHLITLSDRSRTTDSIVTTGDNIFSTDREEASW
jgi:hypothetical protein